MSFVDKVQVKAKAGNGGNGKLSFRHEKYVAHGGPDGGNGGDGGDVILQASRNQDTLVAFRYQKELAAEAGQSGAERKKHGKNGNHLNVMVPIGTVVYDDQNQVIADLTTDGQTAVVAKGGKGGFGNAHFISSRRQAPNFAEKGEPGEVFELTLELKMIADVGLVGLPNAGKSTLLAKISNAHPEIADYPFTTLTPNLGVVDIYKESALLVADIPGLIEGAAEGKGLGHDFLRHIERTSVILHLIDAYTEDVTRAYKSIRSELEAYSDELSKRPEIVALTKIDGLDQEIVSDLSAQLKRVLPKKTSLLAISSKSGEGLNQLLAALSKSLKTTRAKKPKVTQPTIPVLTIKDTSGAWEIKQKGERYIVTGKRIEQFAKRTDFNNDQAVRRFRDIMRRNGITHDLKRRGIEPGQFIQIGNDANSTLEY